MLEERRAKILTELAKYTGRQVPAAFVYRTSNFISGIERFHNLLSGIFKPAWSEYALSIVMKRGSPYEHKDEVIFLEDGRWLMTYSPRSGGLNISDNRALMKCMESRLPVGVFQQLTDKRDRKHGSTYRILGLGLITSFDAKADVFIVESVDQTTLEQITNIIADEEERYEIQLYAQLTNEFRPFIKEKNVTYSISAPKRDEAFRQVILREYDFACAVCHMKFFLNDLIEATAAHIVPKRARGTDDPRNGISLCRTHHWAFDVGIFSLNDNYEVLVSKALYQAKTHNFHLAELSGSRVYLPSHEIIHPHPAALDWHRGNVFKAS